MISTFLLKIVTRVKIRSKDYVMKTNSNFKILFKIKIILIFNTAGVLRNIRQLSDTSLFERDVIEEIGRKSKKFQIKLKLF